VIPEGSLGSGVLPVVLPCLPLPNSLVVFVTASMPL
jgi:hypothetical protein